MHLFCWSTTALCCLLLDAASGFASLPRNAPLKARPEPMLSTASPSTYRDGEVATIDEIPSHASSNIDDDHSRHDTDKTQRRALGAQELFMLPRQHPPSETKFPAIPHVAVFVLSATPSLEVLTRAVQEAMRVHPLLRAHVEGDGEPRWRIDLRRVVRWGGEPNPLMFVCPPPDVDGPEVDDVLKVVDVPSTNAAALETSWRDTFLRDLNDPCGWCDVSTGPLWRMEMHRLEGWNDAVSSGEDRPCAILFSMNHAISDQGSLNVVFDQILSDVAELEDTGGTTVSHPAIQQGLPVALEDSVLGLGKSGGRVDAAEILSRGALRYVSGKVAEGFRSPVLLTDFNGRKEDGGGIASAISILAGFIPGGQDEALAERKTFLQCRSLSAEATNALLRRCRQDRVAISNALAAAVVLASSDFIDGGLRKKNKQRLYKILQSLDTRRFGAKLDGCDTLSCQAGSMDLMLGPVSDCAGAAIQSKGTDKKKFWTVAKESLQQTSQFIKSDAPEQAVRLFDFFMSLSDLGTSVEMVAQSKDCLGRTYTSGITNVGAYERQKAVRRQGEAGRENIKVKHGKYHVQEIYFATTHAHVGCIFPVGCISVDGRMQCTINPVAPLVNEEASSKFADSFVEILETIATTQS